MTFKDLNLNNTLWNALEDAGISKPTAIQEKSFSIIMSGRDVTGIAQTGTGKTFAYLLPLMRMWTFTKSISPTVLILVPTRELVVQVVESAELLTKYMNLTVKGVYGGTNLRTQAYEVQEGCHFLVGTPGRVLDLFYHGAVKAGGIKKLVIDEMDEMLSLGFRSQISHILDLLPERRQNLMFSATITTEVENLIIEYFDDPILVEAAASGTPLDSIKQSSYHVPNFNTKVNLLKLILDSDDSMTKVLLFISTKAMADKLFNEMTTDYPNKIGIIHSNKDQNYRFNSVRSFQEGQIRLLIATDIIARGIDVEDITHVINFDMPQEPESYIHRIGRTGRAGESGVSISFITETDKQVVKDIETLMEYEIPVLELPEGLEISDKLIAEEIPEVRMRNVLGKIPIINEEESAFQPKKSKPITADSRHKPDKNFRNKSTISRKKKKKKKR